MREHRKVSRLLTCVDPDGIFSCRLLFGVNFVLPRTRRRQRERTCPNVYNSVEGCTADLSASVLCCSVTRWVVLVLRTRWVVFAARMSFFFVL